MTVEAQAAAWFLPFVIPLCLITAYTDLRWMKITNKTVTALIAVFAVGGAILLPFDEYLWRWVHLLVVLAAGIALNIGGALGAGDAKFMAAAAPYIMLSDLSLIFWLLAATSLSGFVAHRLVRATPLKALAPDWESWHVGNRFPMGYPLGGALAAYLILKSLGA